MLGFLEKFLVGGCALLGCWALLYTSGEMIAEARGLKGEDIRRIIFALALSAAVALVVWYLWPDAPVQSEVLAPVPAAPGKPVM